MGLRKNIFGSWGERSFFFQGAGSKDPTPPTPRGEGSLIVDPDTFSRREIDPGRVQVQQK